MMRKLGSLFVAVGMSFMVSVGVARAAEEAQPEQGQLVTESEFARWFVQVLGLSRVLPANPSEQQAFAVLLQNGISPKNGWNPTNVVTMGTLSRVIVQGMKRQSEVQNPDDDASWIEFLKSIGIEFGTIGQALDNVEPLDQPVGAEALVVSTDPLTKSGKVRPLDEQQMGVDLQNFASRPLSFEEIKDVVDGGGDDDDDDGGPVTRPRRPRPMTPR